MTAEEKLVRDCIIQAIATFETDLMSARVIRRFSIEVPALFAPVAISLLMTATRTAGYRYLAMLVLKQPSLFKELSNPWNYTREQAVTLSRRLMSVDPTFDTRFARNLPGRNGSDHADTLHGAAAERALDILDEISFGRRLVPMLSHLAEHHDQKISSKATLFIGRRVQSVMWATRLVSEGKDPRVRANAIEAVWGADSPSLTNLFIECTRDRYNRVVGNALVGLHLAGRAEAERLVKRFANDYQPDFRMTSAWTMGRIGSPEFIPSLSAMVRDDYPQVRGAALRSLQTIRQIEKRRVEAAAPPPSVETEAALELVAPVVNVDLRLDGAHFTADRNRRFRKMSEW